MVKNGSDMPWAGEVKTPAFVFDETVLTEDVGLVRNALSGMDARLLFAMKAFGLDSGLRRISALVDGLHASSLFEARLARHLLGDAGLVHLTTPGLRDDETDELFDLCDYVSFNSITQWQRLKDRVSGRARAGLRVNSEMSFIPDERYDPCRRHSKLGVPLSRLAELQGRDVSLLAGVDGILVHTNCESEDFRQLLATARDLVARLSPLKDQLSWINLGGGYIFRDGGAFAPLREAIELVQGELDVSVLIEPGASIVRRAGSIVSSVLDIFDSGGKEIAILDTTVNHMPEVFEFQFEPDVAGHAEGGTYPYILAGSTCLAGDIFGEYAFAAPLSVGSRVVFANAGAYTLVKANLFNGINLPTLYRRDGNGAVQEVREFTYADFLSHHGGIANACV